MPNPKPNPWRELSLLGAIGINFTIWVLGGLFGGRSLDRVLGTQPLFLLVGVFLGIAAGVYTVVQLIKRYL